MRFSFYHWFRRCLFCVPCLAACASNPADDMRRYIQRHGFVVVLEYAGEKEIEQVLGVTPEGAGVFSSLGLHKRSGGTSQFTPSANRKFPETVTVTWRAMPAPGQPSYTGTPHPPVTIPVLSRIPAEIFTMLRKDNDLLLAIIFRLTDQDEVKLGWEVRRDVTERVLAGGDFERAKFFNGKVAKKGWILNAQGQKVEVDY